MRKYQKAIETLFANGCSKLQSYESKRHKSYHISFSETRNAWKD